MGKTTYHQLWAPGWLQERFDTGGTLRSIAAEVGCSEGAVRTASARLGVIRRRAVQRPELRDRAWLHRNYVDEQRSTDRIGAELGVSGNTVAQALHRLGINVRTQAQAQPSIVDADQVSRQYLMDGLSVAEIAAQHGVHHNTIYLALERAGTSRHGHRRSKSPQLDDAGWLKLAYATQRRPIRSIAKEAGSSERTVRAALRRHRISKPSPPRPPRRRLAADWRRRPSVESIARKYGVSWHRAASWLSDTGIRPDAK